MWFPKEQSNPISVMVTEINKRLGNQYFTVSFDGKFYYLNPTKLAVMENKYCDLRADGLRYALMFQYIRGILMGLNASK